MFESVEAQRRVGRYAWVVAWVGLVAGQLHALARHNTADGESDLNSPLTRLWSDPARAALRPLLDWGNPDTVYLTYGKICLPVFLGFTLCAFVTYLRRKPVGFESWAWRLALLGYTWACVAVFCVYWTQLGSYNAFFEFAFVITIPGLLLTLIGSTVLGITLLRRGFAPRLPAWLLALEIPLALGIIQVTSQGSAALPVMFAFGLLGHRLASTADLTPGTGAATTMA